ncbi:hypothetical protein C0J52_14012 [Blattella germanica]|nr:hypothetical protein C0J52_14012 [Blattella germanica]
MVVPCTHVTYVTMTTTCGLFLSVQLISSICILFMGCTCKMSLAHELAEPRACSLTQNELSINLT